MRACLILYIYKVMATIFSRIIAGEIPCYKVAENDKFFAFLDINPLVKGHTLVIPKQEVDYIFDLSDEDLAAMHISSLLWNNACRLFLRRDPMPKKSLCSRNPSGI